MTWARSGRGGGTRLRRGLDELGGALRQSHITLITTPPRPGPAGDE